MQSTDYVLGTLQIHASTLGLVLLTLTRCSGLSSNDVSGNLWYPNAVGGTVTELIGLASPTWPQPVQSKDVQHGNCLSRHAVTAGNVESSL